MKRKTSSIMLCHKARVCCLDSLERRNVFRVKGTSNKWCLLSHLNRDNIKYPQNFCFSSVTDTSSLPFAVCFNIDQLHLTVWFFRQLFDNYLNPYYNITIFFYNRRTVPNFTQFHKWEGPNINLSSWNSNCTFLSSIIICKKNQRATDCGCVYDPIFVRSV